MGARLSQPRGPGGTTESSAAVPKPPPPTPKRPFPRQINSRTIVAPAAAFTMACLLFVYARTSIRAAKANAQRHRDNDTGGEGLSLLNESRRRHGVDKRLERGGNTITELLSEGRSQLFGEKTNEEVAKKGDVGTGLSENEEKLRAMRGRRPGSREG